MGTPTEMAFLQPGGPAPMRREEGALARPLDATEEEIGVFEIRGTPPPLCCFRLMLLLQEVPF